MSSRAGQGVKVVVESVSPPVSDELERAIAMALEQMWPAQSVEWEPTPADYDWRMASRPWRRASIPAKRWRT